MQKNTATLFAFIIKHCCICHHNAFLLIAITGKDGFIPISVLLEGRGCNGPACFFTHINLSFYKIFLIYIYITIIKIKKEITILNRKSRILYLQNKSRESSGPTITPVAH